MGAQSFFGPGIGIGKVSFSHSAIFKNGVYVGMPHAQFTTLQALELAVDLG